MYINLPRNVVSQIRSGEMTEEELKHQLMLNYSIADIVETGAHLLMVTYMNSTPKISISQEEFESHFRIIGVKSDGSIERRGRKRKGQEEDDGEAKLL